MLQCHRITNNGGILWRQPAQSAVAIKPSRMAKQMGTQKGNARIAPISHKEQFARGSSKCPSSLCLALCSRVINELNRKAL